MAGPVVHVKKLRLRDKKSQAPPANYEVTSKAGIGVLRINYFATPFFIGTKRPYNSRSHLIYCKL